ncbi:acyl-homoserine-lactone synthase [Caulobacter soli]|uniref:acyl-homoserine-lactone synthase n=1 Tax=Caulobacter soli TaxID=2708539 RepID=UPI0013EE0746|nr:acyl-homoserine-lactone synthase [Caulobacter soli]
MIHIVTSENRRFYTRELAALRAQRREQLASKDGWVDLVVLDDDDDDDGTIHLLAFDDALRLEAALRLDPTQQRSLLADRFADLIAPGQPLMTGPQVWEATGLFTTRAYRDRVRPDDRSRVCALWAAAMELALVNGVERIVGVIDMALYPSALNAPIDVRLVGVPRPYALGVAAGMELTVSRSLLDRLRESLGIAGPAGYHVDALDLRAFGGLAEVQRQLANARVPQFGPGSARDEALAAETFYRLTDGSGDGRRLWADHDANPPTDRLNV